MDKKIKDLFNKAKLEEYNDHLESSIKILDKIISNSQTWSTINLKARLKKASLLSSVHYSSEALALIQEMGDKIRDKNFLKQFKFVNALVLSDLGEDTKALDLINNNDEFEFSYLRGLIYFRIGDHSRSEFFSRKAIEDNKEKYNLIKAASYRMLASIAISRDDNGGAESNLQKAANNAEGTVFEYDFALLYAEQLNKNDNKSKAAKIVQDILDDEEILYSTKKKAEELLGRIEG